MNYMFLYFRWSSLFFLVLLRILGFSNNYIRIPFQLLFSFFYLFVIYKTLETNQIKDEEIKHLITGISWASFFILDIIRSLIGLGILSIFIIDFLYFGLLVYAIYCKGNNPMMYFGYIMIYILVFLLQDNKKQSLIFVIMRDILFYICYYICLNVFDINSKGNKTEIVNCILKSLICSVWLLLHFLSQYFLPIYLILLFIRPIFIVKDEKEQNFLPVQNVLQSEKPLDISQLVFVKKKPRKDNKKI